VTTALLFGVAPAFRASRAAPIDALKEHGPAFARGASAGRRYPGVGAITLSNGLVVAQVALSLVLVVAAGLFVRTFSRLAAVRLGFDREQILVVNVNATRSGVQADRRVDLFLRLTDAAGAVPGVRYAAASVVTPVSGSTWNTTVTVAGAPDM